MEKTFIVEDAPQRTGKELARPATQKECDEKFGKDRVKAKSMLYHPQYGVVRADLGAVLLWSKRIRP